MKRKRLKLPKLTSLNDLRFQTLEKELMKNAVGGYDQPTNADIMTWGAGGQEGWSIDRSTHEDAGSTGTRSA